MAVRDILLLGNPALRARCASVKNVADGAVRGCAADLRETLDEFRARRGFGRGIAAPQIGVQLRMIYVTIDSPAVMINPVIVRRSRRMMTLWDDCFSFPDILVKVRRNAEIVVRYRDERGAKREVRAEGGLSELLQHEIDHLDGVLAIDRAIDSRHIILRSEWEHMKEHLRETVRL